MTIRIRLIFLGAVVVFTLGIAFLILNNESDTWTLKDYKTQELTWEDCYDGYECSSFKVPVDYEKVDDNSFTLRVLRHSALDQDRRAHV